MRKEAIINKIDKEIQKLGPQEQLKLIKEHAHQLVKNGTIAKRELNADASIINDRKLKQIKDTSFSVSKIIGFDRQNLPLQ